MVDLELALVAEVALIAVVAYVLEHAPGCSRKEMPPMIHWTVFDEKVCVEELPGFEAYEAEMLAYANVPVLLLAEETPSHESMAEDRYPYAS